MVSEHARPGSRFLEVGCGTGYVLRALARECGLRVTGSELFPEGIEYARERVPDADLVVLDARTMPFEEEFDFAGAFDVIEHIEDDVAVLEGMRRALRPEGMLFLTVPQHRWLWSAADEHACHVRRYRRGELAHRVELSGFEVLRVTSFVTSLLPAMALSRWRQRRSSAAFDPIEELVPRPLVNSLAEWMLRCECLLVRQGVNLPVGGSLALLARRLG